MTSTENRVDISSMPIEVIKMILYWIQRLPSTQPDDDQGWEFESSLDENPYPRLRKYLKTTDSLPLKDIRSFLSVNRAFYQTFSPLLFERFDVQGFSADKSKLTIEEIIQRHSNHIKEIRGRVTFPDQPDKDPKLRAKLLLKIIKSCPHITDIDVDLDPNQFPNLFIKPISQLTSLTHLSLSSPYYGQTPYTESFLVEILSDLSGLQGFSCSGIDAVHPKPLDNQQACQSPLGIHLASLPHLVELELESAQCLDVSWSRLKWKSSLRALSFTNCGVFSVSDLKVLAERFKSTLTTLTFARIGLRDPDSLISDPLPTKRFRFRLPELINLEIISSASVRFAKAFEHSKKLSWLSLGNYPLHRHKNLEKLMKDRLWPKLKTLELTSAKTYSYKSVEVLENTCERDGIDIIFNVDLVDDDSFEEDDMY